MRLVEPPISWTMMVIVPFRERRLPGIVMALAPHPAVPDPRPIEGLLDTEPVLPPALVTALSLLALLMLYPLHMRSVRKAEPG